MKTRLKLESRGVFMNNYSILPDPQIPSGVHQIQQHADTIVLSSNIDSQRIPYPPPGITQPSNIRRNLDMISAAAHGTLRGAWQSTCQGVKQFAAYTPYYAFKAGLLLGSATVFIGLSIPYGALSLILDLTIRDMVNEDHFRYATEFDEVHRDMGHLNGFIGAFCGAKIKLMSDSLLRYAGEQDQEVRERKFDHTARGVRGVGDFGKYIAARSYYTFDTLISKVTGDFLLGSWLREIVLRSVNIGGMGVLAAGGIAFGLASLVVLGIGFAIDTALECTGRERIFTQVPPGLRIVRNRDVNFLREKVYNGCTDTGKEAFVNLMPNDHKFMMVKCMHEALIDEMTPNNQNRIIPYLQLDAFPGLMEYMNTNNVTIQDLMALRELFIQTAVLDHYDGLLQEGYMDSSAVQEHSGLEPGEKEVLMEISQGQTERAKAIQAVLQNPKLVGVIKIISEQAALYCSDQTPEGRNRLQHFLQLCQRATQSPSRNWFGF